MPEEDWMPWIVRNVAQEIICRSTNYDVALAVWHRELYREGTDGQLGLF